MIRIADFFAGCEDLNFRHVEYVDFVNASGCHSGNVAGMKTGAANSDGLAGFEIFPS